MKFKKEFDDMLGDWGKYTDYINQSIIFLEKNNCEDVDRILATLMRINQLRRLKEWGESYNYGRGFKTFFKKFKEGHNEIFDHVASIYDKKNKKRFLISEPYGISDESLGRLIKLCEENNIHFQIRGESIHFPNRTIQIVFEKDIKTEIIKKYQAIQKDYDKIDWLRAGKKIRSKSWKNKKCFLYLKDGYLKSSLEPQLSLDFNGNWTAFDCYNKEIIDWEIYDGN